LLRSGACVIREHHLVFVLIAELHGRFGVHPVPLMRLSTGSSPYASLQGRNPSEQPFRVMVDRIDQHYTVGRILWAKSRGVRHRSERCLVLH
jgi:hypothetical protein